MLTKTYIIPTYPPTYLPTQICDSSDNSDSSDICDISDSSEKERNVMNNFCD